MKNNKQFFSVLLSVLICVFVFGVIVYATTTIGDSIIVDTASDNDDKAISTLASVSSSAGGITTYGLYNDVVIDAEAAANSYAYGVYNDVVVSASYLGVVAFPAGIYNNIYAAVPGAQITGIKTYNNGGSYPDIAMTNTDARYTSLYGGGSVSQVRGERLEISLKSDDGLLQYGYGISMAVQAMGASDRVYGWYMTDNSDITGGTEYGVYLDLTDTDATRYGIYETGGAINYFKGKIGIGTLTPSEELSVVGTVNISQDLWASGSLNFGGGGTIATTSYSRLGSTATGHSLSDADDLMISGGLEVNETAYFDSTVSLSSSGIILDGGITITTGIASPSGNCSAVGNPGSLFIETGTGTVNVCGTDNIWNPLD